MKKLNFCKNIFTVIVISFILASCGSNRSAGGAGGDGSGNSGVGTNNITLSPTERTVNEDVSRVNFILSLDETANKLLTIKYRTETGEGDTAIAGEDYVDANGTATIDIGKTSTIFSVDIIQDKIIETTEQFSIILSDLKVYVKQADGRLILATSNTEFSLPVKQAKVIIEDNSKIVLFVKAGQVEELERDTGETSKLIFEIGIENEILALDDINLDFSTATDDDANMMAHVGVDYKAVVNRPITITKGSHTATTDVVILGDNMLEGSERFRAIINNLRTETDRDLIVFAGGDSSSSETVAIISDNDRLTFRVAVENNQIEGDRTVDVGLAVDNNEIEGSFGLSQVRIRYEATLDKRSEIAGGYVRAKAGDFEATSGVIVFDSMSMADASMDFSFKLRGDEILEADETLLLRFTSIDGASRILGLDDNDATVIIIQNDERATLTIADASHNESSPSPFEFTIESDIEIAEDVTIDIRANITSIDTSSDDFNLIPLYHLAKGKGNRRTTVEIPVVNDDLVEMNETFRISLDSTSSQVDTSNDIINTDTALGTIINDDKAVFRLNSPGSLTEADRDATSRLPFTINTTSSIAPNIMIPIIAMTTGGGTATKDSDFINKSETINFSSSITGSMFAVTVNGDNLVELTETLEVSARIDSVQTGVLASFENNSATARATIFDNDRAEISLGFASDSAISEPATAADSTSFNFRISTTNPISVPVKLTYIIGDAEAERTALEEQDYRTPTGDLASGNLTLAANTTTVDLPITIIGDDGFEHSERLTVTLMGLIIDSQFKEKVSLSSQNARSTAVIDNHSSDSASTLTIRPYTQTIDEGVRVTFYVDIARNGALSNAAFNYEYRINAMSGISNDDFIDATIGNGNEVSRTIPVGSNRSVINIMTYDDNEIEFAEKFRVLIFDKDNVGVKVTANTANVTINDNDLAELANVTFTPTGRTIAFDFNYAIKYLQPDRVTIAYQKGETAPANCQLGTIVNVDGTPASYRLESLESGQQYSFRFCIGKNNKLTEGIVRSVTTLPDMDDDGILDANDVDNDNDGLIDIRTAEEFNNIRHNLAGTGYNTGGGNNTRGSGKGDRCSFGRYKFLREIYYYYVGRLCGYELMNDIDLSSDANFLPFGMADGATITEDASFTAIFDGNGYTISNLSIQRPNSNKVGLFAKLDKAIIQNVNFENVAITANSEVGTVAGTSVKGYFKNIKLKSGSVTANNGARIGGLVGVFQNHEEDAIHYINHRYFHGLVDYKLSNGARNVHNRLNITANYTGSGVREGVGGLVGASQASYIIHSSSNATINVSANISDVGGLVGSLTVNTALDNDRATGSSWYRIPVNGSISIVPKIPMYVERSIVRQSFSAGSIITPANEALVVGGLVGRNTKHGRITHSYSAVNITGTIGSGTNSAVPIKAIGGLIGYNNGYVGSTYATGSITNTNVANVGGLIGFSNNVTIYSRNFKVDSKTGTHGSNYHSHNWITTITLDHLEGLRGDNGDDGKDWKTNGYANWFHFGYVFNNDPNSQIWDSVSLNCDRDWKYYNNQTIWVMRGTRSFYGGWRHPPGNDNTISQVAAPTTDENGNRAAYYQMPAIRCMGTTDSERKANIDYQRRLFRR